MREVSLDGGLRQALEAIALEPTFKLRPIDYDFAQVGNPLPSMSAGRLPPRGCVGALSLVLHRYGNSARFPSRLHTRPAAPYAAQLAT